MLRLRTPLPRARAKWRSPKCKQCGCVDGVVGILIVFWGWQHARHDKDARKREMRHEMIISTHVLLIRSNLQTGQQTVMIKNKNMLLKLGC